MANVGRAREDSVTGAGVAMLVAVAVSVTACAPVYEGGGGWLPSFTPTADLSGSSYAYGCGDCGRGRHHHRGDDHHHHSDKKDHKQDHKHHHRGGGGGGGGGSGKKEHKRK
jgi:hypothetical protein